MNPEIRIALLHSLTGSMELAERSVLESTLKTIEEINASGGILAHTIEPLIQDGGSSAEVFAERTLHMLDQGVRIFSGCYSSISRKSIRPLIEESGALLFFPAPHEGFESSPSIVYTGLTLNQQLLPLFTWMRQTGRKSLYHIGTNLVYQRVLGRMMRLYADQNSVRFLGEYFLPGTGSDLSADEIMEQALRSDADLFIISFSGEGKERFQRALRASNPNGTRKRAFLSIYGETYDMTTDDLYLLSSHPEMSTVEAGARNSLMLLKLAIEQAGSYSPSEIKPILPGLELTVNGRSIKLNPNLYLQQESLIVACRPDGHVIEHAEMIEPLPYLGLEKTDFALKPLAQQSMAGYSDSVHLSLLLERKNQKQKEIEKELHKYQYELEDRVRERTESLERSTRKLEGEIQQRELIEEALGESQRRFRQILEDTLLIAVVLDQRGCIVYANQTLLQKTGWNRSEIIERNWFERFIPQRPDLSQRFHDALQTGNIKPKLEHEIRTRSGETLFIRWSNTLLREAGESITGVVSMGEDITTQREAAEALRKSEEKLRTLFTSMTDVILVIEENGSLLEVAPTASELLQQNDKNAEHLRDYFSAEQTEFIIGSIAKVLNLNQPMTVEYSMNVTGNEHWFEARISPLDARSVLLVARDATERMQAQRALHAANLELERRVADRTKQLQTANARLIDLATRDELTGIANRRLFNDSLDSEVRRARREKRPLSLLFCDVDYFKNYNDTYGHQAGDDCLRQIGAVLARLFRRAGDLPARYGGEEFAVILPGVDAFQALILAEKLRSDIEALQIEHRDSVVSPFVTLSIGLVCLPVKAQLSASLLIQEADNALYRSKEAGRNQITVANPT